MLASIIASVAASVVASVIAPAVARAQPAESSAAPDGPGRGSAAPAAPAATLDEARIRELVDREVARILTERAVKEAAELAAKDAEKEAAATDDTGELKGSSGFMDTRLAFTITNENVLARPGETIPSVPGWRFGTPSSLGVLFFDNYDTRYSGFENLSHATMYRDYASGHLEAEAALVLRIDDLSETHIGLSDDGSYLTVSDWKDPTHKDPTRISLTAFPVSADRFRLGYSYRLSWGGSPEYNRATSSTPGIKLQYDGPNMYAFVGAKSAVIPGPRPDDQPRAALAVLAGAGIDPVPMLRLEANGGYFDRGNNELDGVQGEKVRLYGASVQASIHQGMPLRSSIDYRLYKFHGESITGLFAPERYPGGLSWLVQSELTALGQTLADPVVGSKTTRQIGMAGDLNVRVKINRVRLRLDVSYRDLAFILHSEPSVPRFRQFRDDYVASADKFVAIGFDRNWGDWLTLGLIAGIEKPATLTAPPGQPVVPGVDADPVAESTAVFRSNNVDTLITILPPLRGVSVQAAVKGTARIDFARVFSVLLEVFYSNDRNLTRARVCQEPEACSMEVQFARFHQLGLNATLQARF